MRGLQTTLPPLIPRGPGPNSRIILFGSFGLHAFLLPSACRPASPISSRTSPRFPRASKQCGNPDATPPRLRVTRVGRRQRGCAPQLLPLPIDIPGDDSPRRSLSSVVPLPFGVARHIPSCRNPFRVLLAWPCSSMERRYNNKKKI